MSLSALKKQSKAATEKLKSAMTDEKSGGGYQPDDRMWSPGFDKDKGTGSAIVRFLPAPEGEDLPWIKVFSHGFKGPTGKWYIENSLTTLGEDDPLGDLNSRLWNSGVESDKDVARSQKRRINYYSNVLVIKDPANPANEGKVFLYRYGQKIYNMIQEQICPEFDDDEAMNPFDAWNGANFNIRIRTVAGFRNYDKSNFSDPEEIGTDSEIEDVWGQCHSLQGELSRDNFKSYDQLKNRLYEVLGATAGSGVEVIENSIAPVAKEAKKEAPAPEKKEKVEASASVEAAASVDSSDVDDDMAFFEDL